MLGNNNRFYAHRRIGCHYRRGKRTDFAGRKVVVRLGPSPVLMLKDRFLQKQGDSVMAMDMSPLSKSFGRPWREFSVWTSW